MYSLENVKCELLAYGLLLMTLFIVKCQLLAIGLFFNDITNCKKQKKRNNTRISYFNRSR